MGLKEIVLGAGLLLSTAAFGQKYDFNVYTDLLSFEIKAGTLKKKEGSAELYFLGGVYKMSMDKKNDSTYVETIESMFGSREEKFSYSIEDSCYSWNYYETVKGDERKKKREYFNKVKPIDSKYKSLVDIIEILENDELLDTVPLMILGATYDMAVSREERDGKVVFRTNLGNYNAPVPDENMKFSGSLEIWAKPIGDRLVPYYFETSFTRKGKTRPLRGRLIE